MKERTLFRELVGLALLFWAAFLVLSLWSYSPLDPSINQVVGEGYKVKNIAGLVGAYTSGLLVDFFGLAAWFWPLLCLYLAAYSFFTSFTMAWWRWLGVCLMVAAVMTWAGHPFFAAHLHIGKVAGSGFLGAIVYKWSRFLLRPVGAALFWSFVFLGALQLALGITWARLFGGLPGLLAGCRGSWSDWCEERRAKKEAKREAKLVAAREREEREKEDLALVTRRTAKPKKKKPPRQKAKEKAATPPEDEFTFENGDDLPGDGGPPPIDLLVPGDAKGKGEDQKILEGMSRDLVSSLADFGVKGEVTSIRPGPVVTMFEFKPAPGVKISRISGLSDDLALALKAHAVRAEAVPGGDAVGIEIPNEKREMVRLREVIEDKSFTGSKSKLTLALGKDVFGDPYCADLARMPHLLVAGATGAGKSVCLNDIILSFLYKADPDEVKLLLVDPKRIELSVYASLPHLVHPVVTDMSLAKSALDWAVSEMDRRYEAMARMSARNIDGYNAKLAQLSEERRAEMENPEPMPFLVIIVDELADLMMTAGKEAEISIVRLAQLARAAGIHLILATQRPSVDVVTGLIKANFPSRISFQVTSKHDSRTILDMMGAERLLGRGDSLYKPSGSKLVRVHGAYVSEEEIARVVTFWKNRRPQSFDVDFADFASQGDAESGGESRPGAMDGDEFYHEAVEFVVGQGKASISLLQRRFRIGFNRAARYIEQMEMDGLLGPQEGSKPRTVLRGRD